MIKPAIIKPDAKLIQDAAYYAFTIVFDSFEQGYKPRFGNGGLIKHLIGKIGELAFFRYCMENGIAVKHTPFRNDYSKLNGKDDFIISIFGYDIPVEVKTQTVKEINGDLRLFYNKEQYYSRQKDGIVVFVAINPEITKISILGWIHLKDIEKYPIWEKNLQSPAFAIPVSALKDLRILVGDSDEL